MVGAKGKGSSAERELLHTLWEKGFAVLRVAGSGSTQFDACDLIAGRAGRSFAIEVKACGGAKQYISFEQMAELNRFSAAFGAQPIIAVKWTRKGWGVIDASKMQRTGKHYGIARESMTPLADWIITQTIGFTVATDK
jgi:holliday junction resolvase Hjr